MEETTTQPEATPEVETTPEPPAPKVANPDAHIDATVDRIRRYVAQQINTLSGNIEHDIANVPGVDLQALRNAQLKAFDLAGEVRDTLDTFQEAEQQ
jgi:hypothetical protein